MSVSNNLIKTIFKNTGFIMLGNLILKVINFVFNVYVIRKLGGESFGQYSTVIAFVSLFQIFAELGMSQYVMREIARDRSKTNYYFWNLVLIRFILALGSIIWITVIASLLGYPSALLVGIFLYACTFLLSAFQSPLQIVLSGHERFEFVSAMNIIGQIVFVILGTIALLNGAGFAWLIVASLVNLSTQIIVGIWAVRQQNQVNLSPQIDVHAWLPLIKSGLPFGIITLSLTIAFNIDTVMLSKYVSATEVGWYNVAYNLVFTILFVSSSFKEAMTPSLSKTFAQDPEEVEKWYFRTVKLITLISLPIAIGGMMVATPIITTLYSAAYQPAAQALRIIIWDIPFLMFASFGGNLSTVIKKEKIGARIYVITAIANIVMNLIAIPRLGYIGAAITTVLTDLIAGAQFYVFLRKQLRLPPMRVIFFKIFLASFVMGSVIYLARQLNPIFIIALGILIYTAFIFILRILDDAEKSLIQRIFGKVMSVLPAKSR